MIMFVYLYAAINLICCVFYGYDKLQSIRGGWRIRERTLLIMTVFGPFGALVAVNVFRHKTKHTSFVCLVTSAVLIHSYLLYRFLI